MLRCARGERRARRCPRRRRASARRWAARCGPCAARRTSRPAPRRPGRARRAAAPRPSAAAAAAAAPRPSRARRGGARDERRLDRRRLEVEGKRATRGAFHRAALLRRPRHLQRPRCQLARRPHATAAAAAAAAAERGGLERLPLHLQLALPDVRRPLGAGSSCTLKTKRSYRVSAFLPLPKRRTSPFFSWTRCGGSPGLAMCPTSLTKLNADSLSTWIARLPSAAAACAHGWTRPPASRAACPRAPRRSWGCARW